MTSNQARNKLPLDLQDRKDRQQLQKVEVDLQDHPRYSRRDRGRPRLMFLLHQVPGFHWNHQKQTLQNYVLK